MITTPWNQRTRLTPENYSVTHSSSSSSLSLGLILPFLTFFLLFFPPDDLLLVLSWDDLDPSWIKQQLICTKWEKKKISLLATLSLMNPVAFLVLCTQSSELEVRGWYSRTMFWCVRVDSSLWTKSNSSDSGKGSKRATTCERYSRVNLAPCRRQKIKKLTVNVGYHAGRGEWEENAYFFQ